MTAAGVVRAAGITVVLLSLVPALAWAPHERSRLRYPRLPWVQAGATMAAGLGLMELSRLLT